MGLGAHIAVDGRVDAELAGASQVEVYERLGETTTFRIRYDVDIGKGDLPRLADERLGPGSMLSVLVPVKGTSHCLVMGPVQGQRIHLVHGGPGSWLEVHGADASSPMDREDRSAIWADVSDSEVVATLAQRHGLVPDVESTSARHSERQHTLVQRESDLRLVRRLARRNGYLFWVTANAMGVKTAHFKRPPLGGTPAVSLSINSPSPQVRALDLQWDVERPTRIEARQLDLNTKEAIDGGAERSPLSQLGAKDLGSVTGEERSLFLSAPADDAGGLRARAEGALQEALWFIRARCEVRLDTVGTLVRAHTVVELLGAGRRHSGRYLVAAVRHTLDASLHRMELELARNGWEA
ncbi:phage late control D family protein [Myxococcus sp. RHSTA-1-4]|uniref:phage late control D family protein n=1 Tax=Myxococcus sp. RHSTA-1-4 TaxID=2874601 RepID=UPI00272DDA00|nr:contractile injection system protein, VgrG/Pvc8 family [Myxococcus sp. RHSTA-1-4]MBZ4420174.1 hypothetical protein [Myxococcus sp. RHSTA-1-4]